MALVTSVRYQQNLQRYHDKHIRKRDLNVGDVVVHRRQSNQGYHKLTPPWEGPYVVALAAASLAEIACSLNPRASS